MNGPLAMIFVVLIIVIGIGAAWAITAQGASTAPIHDSFGNTQTTDVINQTNATSGFAVSTMPVLYIAFIIVVCVVLVVAFVWLWNTGKNKKGKY
jgi:hypothetical protein